MNTEESRLAELITKQEAILARQESILADMIEVQRGQGGSRRMLSGNQAAILVAAMMCLAFAAIVYA